MKEKNLPDDINSKSLDELTQEANNIIEQLEKKDDLKNFQYGNRKFERFLVH